MPESPDTERQPPSREELIAQLEDLKQRAEALRDRVEQQNRLPPHVVALRVFFLLGLPLIVAVATYVASESFLYAALALVGTLAVTVMIALKLTPTPPGPGTRAWEAEHTARLLSDVIFERRQEQAATDDDDERARLGREIAFLTEQYEDNRRIAASGDRSPGTGSIGFTPYSGD